MLIVAALALVVGCGGGKSSQSQSDSGATQDATLDSLSGADDLGGTPDQAQTDDQSVATSDQAQAADLLGVDQQTLDLVGPQDTEPTLLDLSNAGDSSDLLLDLEGLDQLEPSDIVPLDLQQTTDTNDVDGDPFCEAPCPQKDVGTPDVAPPCEHQCDAVGSLSCDGKGAFKTCVLDTDGCRIWGPSTSCANGDSCSDGVCLPQSCPQSDCQTVGATICEPDQKGYRVCSVDPTNGCPKLGPVVACESNGQCQPNTGTCLYKDNCVEGPNVVLLVDRSNSMQQQGLWRGAKVALRNFVKEYWTSAKFGLRTFPGGPSGCGVSALTLEQELPNLESFLGLLKDPAGDGATALADALDNIVIGDTPLDTTYVILITDGEETCKTESDVYNSIYKLRNRGVKVFTVGLGKSYNAALLQKAAVIGGTKSAHFAPDGPALYQALLQVANELTICCIDPDGDGKGRHCALLDCNESMSTISGGNQLELCLGQSCGIDNCGETQCGICGPEGDLGGLWPKSPWPGPGYSPTQQRRSPLNPPRVQGIAGPGYELRWSLKLPFTQPAEKMTGGAAILENGAIYLTRHKSNDTVSQLYRGWVDKEGVKQSDKTILTFPGKSVVAQAPPTLAPHGIFVPSSGGVFQLDYEGTIKTTFDIEEPADPRSGLTVGG
ncbi:MAG: VWA domain-containing protein, partial [Myxococcales bacterium]|nr:VWA domain-containing protein [Myxococcales bacterium]